jgi:type VI protein secretion system component VasF
VSDPHDQARQEARRKLVGRAMVVGLLLLVALYAVFTYLGRR